jgi:hypothetical protein
MVGGWNAINATLYDKLSFNFSRDIAPVAGIVRALNVMVINPSFPAKSVPEFIAYAKANPGKISMASAGIGSGPHLYGELFKIWLARTRCRASQLWENSCRASRQVRGMASAHPRTCRDRREAQQGDQRGARRSQDASTACRLWRHGLAGCGRSR